MPRLYTFVAGSSGPWSITRVMSVVGESLDIAPRLDVLEGDVVEGTPEFIRAAWSLRGITSNERYATRPEKSEMAAVQETLGRPAARHAALIPIRKSAAWWALTQDERRSIFEEQSHHVRLGMQALPAVARRLHHCRDLSEHEPFDFLTFFDYAPEDEAAFNDLLTALRATEEWRYVDREVDIRLIREP